VTGPAILPGEHISSELEELNMSASELAKAPGIPAIRLAEIIRGRRTISADRALRLARWIATTPELWMYLQKN